MTPTSFVKTAVAALTLTLLISPAIAQQHQVKSVRFVDNGKTVVINYDLQGDYNKKYDVTLHLSDDFGYSYQIHPRSVTGDVGKHVKPGYGKKIVWHIKEDILQGLKGDGFVFAVDAEVKKGGSKWPLYLAGAAGVIGGTVFMLTRGAEKEEARPSVVPSATAVSGRAH